MEQIFLLLGTNQGQLKANLERALQELEKKKIRIVKKSKIYKTKPWGNPYQPTFLNMAVEVSCDYSPLALLKMLKSIETKLGRMKTSQRWGPRIIDIDVLFYGDRIVSTKDLVIPHKEFDQRPFAIKLLAEIAPDFTPPHSTKSMKEYALGADDEGIQVYCD